MRIVDHAVKNSVSDGGVADDIVPTALGKLACDNGRGDAAPVFQYFKEIATFPIRQFSQAPVVEDEHRDAGKPGQQFAIAAVGAGAMCIS